MPRKSNKTSHVLNLLSGEGSPADEPKPQENPPVKEEDAVPEIQITEQFAAQDDPVADLIKDSLESELGPDPKPSPTVNSTVATDAATVKAAPSPIEEKADFQSEPLAAQPHETTHTPEAVSTPQPVDVLESPEPPESSSLSAPTAEPVTPVMPDQPAVSQTSPQPTDQSSPPSVQKVSEPPVQEIVKEIPTQPEESPFQIINVMEYIVKDKVLTFMEQFDMCTCKRCITDTTALSLTKLPAKYIVMDKNAVSPLLNYYSIKYIGQVTVELTKSCIAVREKPHH